MDLKEDGSLIGVFESTIKVNGTYTVNLFDMTLILKDPVGIHSDQEVSFEFGGELPGRSHHVLVDNASGEAFIKKNEALTIEKYIQEESPKSGVTS